MWFVLGFMLSAVALFYANTLWAILKEIQRVKIGLGLLIFTHSDNSEESADAIGHILGINPELLKGCLREKDGED